MIDNRIPLVDLHRHLDGNIRTQTILELGQKFAVSLPASTVDTLNPHVQITQNEPDLISFLKKLDFGVSVLGDLDACKRVAYENMQDAHRSGLDYVELRFSPYYMAMNHNLNVADVVSAVIDGIQQGREDFPVKANLIGILSRSFGQQACMQELDGILAHQSHIVAIDLAGDELGFPGEQFRKHFNKARDNGMQITVHAGEADGPQSIWQAIKELGATRIGHGVKAVEDPSLMAYLAEHQIAIESCPTSNLQTGTVSDLTQHPLAAFLDAGVLATLNTDDSTLR